MNTTAYRLRAVLCALAALCLLSGPAWAADPAKKPDGFRGIPFGAQVSGLKDMHLVESDGDFADYDRKSDKMDLGGMPVEMVTYGFYKGQFYHAAIAYSGTTGFDAVQETMVAKYGKPDVMTERADDSGRTYLLAAWNWPGYAYIGHRRYKDGSAGRVFYFYSPLVEASKGAAGSAVATAAMSPTSPGAGNEAPAAAEPRPGEKRGGEIRMHERPSAAEAPASAPVQKGPAQKTPAASEPTVQAQKPTPKPPTDVPARRGEPETPAAAGLTHTVAKGDMLSALAKRYGTTSAAIQAANPGLAPTNLKLGQVLRIPGRGEASPETPTEIQVEAPAAPPAPAVEPAPAPETKPAKAQTAQAGRTTPEPATPAAPKAEPEPKAEPKVEFKPEPAPKAEKIDPEPAASTAPAKAAAPGTHVIAPGDMISALAKHYGVTEKDILKANPGLKPGNLQLGQVVKLPKGAKAGAAEAPGAAPKPEARPESEVAAKPEPRSESPATPEPTPGPAPVPMPEPGPEPAAVSEPRPDAAPAVAPTAAPQSRTAPAAPAASPKVQAGAAREHVLEFEDTLSGLAKRYGVTTEAILKANPGLDPKKLKPGRKIKIP